MRISDETLKVMAELGDEGAKKAIATWRALKAYEDGFMLECQAWVVGGKCEVGLTVPASKSIQ